MWNFLKKNLLFVSLAGQFFAWNSLIHYSNSVDADYLIKYKACRPMPKSILNAKTQISVKNKNNPQGLAITLYLHIIMISKKS